MAAIAGDFQDHIVRRYDAPMYRAMLEVYSDQIHPGFVRAPDDDLLTASSRPTARLAELAELRPGRHVLETACGVGGTARFLADHHGVRVVATNISREQLAIAAERTRPGAAISFEFADYHALPFADASFDVYLCQDSLLYAVDRPQVLAEAFRVLVPGGTLAVSDILAIEAPAGELVDVLGALSAPGFWSAADYRAGLARAGFVELRTEDWNAEVLAGYRRIDAEIAARRDRLVALAGAAEVDATIARYALWLRAVAGSCLGWGAFVARKPGAK